MTQEEQKRIIRSLETLGEQGAVALSQRLEEWATKQFSKNGKAPELGSRGLFVQYRVAAVEEWQRLKEISITKFSWETRDDSRNREEAIKGLFYWQNLETSNAMGDVIAVRYMPFISVNGKDEYKEDETKMFDCTDTGERRQWNHLDFQIYTKPSGGVRGYYLIKPDIEKGDDINWYESWHFSLEDDAPCPVAPIIVEEIDDYKLVVRYRDKLYTLSMELGQPHSIDLEEDVPVEPTHNWDSMWLRPPYTFTLVLTVSWKEKLYSSSDWDNFHEKPHLVRTSDLPEGVRTMQQIDHDAWEEAVRSGAIK